ncbi:hypothetical protein BGY98DRAFT_1020824 [Russula aff. rugulosa BPL654]|nr:hypothetical protein BGY98DRAFT_1020824 [Russula aff. rugulosa BPL654]
MCQMSICNLGSELDSDASDGQNTVGNPMGGLFGRKHCPPRPYTGGQTLSFCQPHDLGPISSIPYAPGIPSSTNCQTYQITRLFTDFVSFGRLPRVVVVHCQLILTYQRIQRRGIYHDSLFTNILELRFLLLSLRKRQCLL